MGLNLLCYPQKNYVQNARKFKTRKNFMLYTQAINTTLVKAVIKK